MLIPYLFLNAIALALYGLSPVMAQNLTEKVWAVFAYSIHGESTPSTFSRSSALTAYGAEGLYAAGSAFRDRYVIMHSERGSRNRGVENLSRYVLRSDEVSVLSPADPTVIASAQAFMQGLYPPLDTSHGAPYVEASSQLADGSSVKSPLHGYQYPPIVTLSSSDPRSVAVTGQTECVMYQALAAEYNASPEAMRITRDSSAFYDYLYDRSLAGAYERSSVNYENACEISEYLDYQSIHNGSLFDDLTRADIDRARWYADRYTFATNGNTSSMGILQRLGTFPDGKIRTIAGQTLASQILGFFEANARHRGSHGLMSFAFGSYEPAVALASLMKLASPKSANFYSRPVHGASLVFELFSVERKKYPKYPSPSDLLVRFSLRNGTNSSTPFTPHPLFGHSPSNLAIPLSEFRMEMGKIALGSIQNWCLRCESAAVFCLGAVNASQPGLLADNIDPTLAGVIGTVVTFIFLAIMAIVWFLVCDIRIQRKPRSRLGGFKGDGKMASDSDLTFKGPNWGHKTVDILDNENNSVWGTASRGHERSGSWEMMQQRELNLSASIVDEDDEEWQMHSILKPAKVRENV